MSNSTAIPTLRLKSAFHRRSGGVVVEKGQTFEPTELEWAVIQRQKQVGVKFEVVEEEASDDQPTSTKETAARAPKGPTMKDWVKKVSPEEYLRQWPNGPQAALARQLVKE